MIKQLPLNDIPYMQNVSNKKNELAKFSFGFIMIFKTVKVNRSQRYIRTQQKLEVKPATMTIK
jgi:hypothetical protein